MMANSDQVTLLVLSVCVCTLIPLVGAQKGQDLEEELFLKHLPDGRVLAHFEFKTAWDIHPLAFSHPSSVHHYGIFPKSLAEVVSHYRVQELHLSLTQGKWRTRVWGYPPISSPPGAEFWTWFLPDTDADTQWLGLVNAMSGLLCTHLNSIDHTSTYQPWHSFKPQGAVVGNLSSALLRYAALPRETVCTENFTPWTKLHPCGASAGLSTLFSALRLYDTDFHSLGLHFSPFCKEDSCKDVGVQLVQTLTVVFPPSVRNGRIGWSLQSLFMKPLTSSCPLASSSRIVLDNSNLLFTVVPAPSSVRRATAAGDTTEWLVYDIANLTAKSEKFDLLVKSSSAPPQGMPSSPVLNVQRFLTGSGHEWGGLHTEITNHHPSLEVKLLYLDMIPWFCRVYIHTLQITNGSVLEQHYQPAKDRLRPHMLEMLLRVPPHSTTSITLQFNRAFLKWTEHPPDAHHGFYINSAVITTVLSDCLNCTWTATNVDRQLGVVLRLHTETLLVSLPTPDFSMPYNVICFVCTIIAIGFGSVFNLTTRTLQPATAKNQGLISRLLTRLRLKRESHAEPDTSSPSEDTS